MVRFSAVFTVILCSFTAVFPQVTHVMGLRENTPSVYALTNARIVVAPGNVIENGTLVIRNGIIEAAGRNLRPPADAWPVDLEGKTIYPGFIDLWAEMGFPDPDAAGRRQIQALNIPAEYAEVAAQFLSAAPGPESAEGALHHNPQVRSWFDVAASCKPEEDRVNRLRSEGFVLANVVYPAGIFRGKTALVTLGEGDNNKLIFKRNVTQSMSFERSRGLGGGYPSSLMGVISLIRQTWYDVDWYAGAHAAYSRDPGGLERPELNLALEALLDAGRGRQPVLIDVNDEIAFMRAHEIGTEFGLNMWVRGSGHEYRRLQEIKNTAIPVVLPLDFPRVPEIESPEAAMNISLEELRHWDFAPGNPGRLAGAGVKIALTASGTGEGISFLERLRSAVERGLDEEDALAALTSTPAQMLGIEKQYGSVEKGKVASFIVADGSIFRAGTRIEEVWIDGFPYEVSKPADPDVRGTWEISSAETGDMILEVRGTVSRLSGSVKKDEKSIPLVSVKADPYRITLNFRSDSIGIDGVIRLSASISGTELSGIGEMPDGRFMNWKAVRRSDFEEPADDDKIEPSDLPEAKMLYPSMEYGYEAIPDMPDNLLVRNATIWTQGPSGKLENADMLVSRGKIAEVGRNIRAPRNALVIDAGGRHVTPGLVDPHLHTSIRGGVNETGNNMTMETRISDVIEPDNIWVYRLLAGGLTAANLLHGSANPVGGQDAVVKMRWGAVPGEMLLEGAKPGLKLALGENVVRNSNQYPNTRMGAEQIIRDAFQSAKDYMEEWNRWERSKTGIPPRKDLQMEALAEVLRGERIVHAHAYRQDEMQMLMRLAEETGFRIASFEHTLEGYKIADILRDHGAAAIVWTDWSSFKVESADGILYNAAMLLDQGVLTSLHSDNVQLATRMNWEAGKILATGIDEVTAMDLITINPARILGADSHIGSLEPGKDADFVIWSGHPLSGFSHAEQTWVDGRKYFDRQADPESRQKVIQERAALIRRAAAASQASAQPAARQSAQRPSAVEDSSSGDFTGNQF